MDADLDLLLIYVFCIADDLLPTKSINHRRNLTDAEAVTLAVAQSIMGIPSDHRFIRTAITRLGHLFPGLTQRSGSTADATARRHDRGADRFVCASQPGLGGQRAAHRFHPDGVRPVA